MLRFWSCWSLSVRNRRWYKYLMLATATKEIRLERCGREETQSDTCQESSVRAVGSAGAPQQSRWSSLLSPASSSCSWPHPSSSLAVSSNIPAIPLSSDISASFPPGFHFLSLTRRGPLVWPILVQFVFNILRILIFSLRLLSMNFHALSVGWPIIGGSKLIIITIIVIVFIQFRMMIKLSSSSAIS